MIHRQAIYVLVPFLAACSEPSSTVAASTIDRCFDADTRVKDLEASTTGFSLQRRALLRGVEAADWQRILGYLRAASLRKRGGECSLSSLMHGVRLHGTSMPIEAEGDQRVLDAVLSTHVGASLFRSPAVHVTRYGARFRWPAMTFQQRSVLRESHVDQTLACLGEYGIPIRQPLAVGENTLCLFDVLRDCVLNFDPKGDELDWTAIALIHYLPPMRAWRTRFGQVYSFDELARLLVDRRRFLRSSCAGSHRFHALVYLLRAHERESILSPRVFRKVQRRVEQLRDLAVSSQRPDGSWGRLWHEPRARWGKNADQGGRHLVLTGHLGEVLLTLPARMRVPDEVLRRAGTWLWNKLRAATEKDFASRLCPWTHAACVVRQVMEGDQ